MDLVTVTQRIAQTGLTVRGGFHPGVEDGVPGAARTAVLLGDVAGRLWPVFCAARRDETDPLDVWTRRIVGPAAADLGAAAVYPFEGPPYLPFQRWATRAEGLKPSPVGPLAHPEFGLWHSYRAALLFDEEIALDPLPEPEHPCDGCRDRPCLAGCPVGAFDGPEFALDACLGHITGAEGTDCMTGGCLARRACPVGRDYEYAPDHQAFLAAAFVKAFGR